MHNTYTLSRRLIRNLIGTVCITWSTSSLTQVSVRVRGLLAVDVWHRLKCLCPLRLPIRTRGRARIVFWMTRCASWRCTIFYIITDWDIIWRSCSSSIVWVGNIDSVVKTPVSQGYAIHEDSEADRALQATTSISGTSVALGNFAFLFFCSHGFCLSCYFSRLHSAWT